MLAVTQDAATNEPDATYPATEADLIKAVAKTWTFPETSDYISLELNEEKHYSLTYKNKNRNAFRRSERHLYNRRNLYGIR